MAVENVTTGAEAPTGPLVTNHNLFNVLRTISGHEDPAYARGIRIRAFDALSAAEMQAVTALERIMNTKYEIPPGETEGMALVRTAGEHFNNLAQNSTDPTSFALLLRSAQDRFANMSPAEQAGLFLAADRSIGDLEAARNINLNQFPHQIQQLVASTMMMLNMGMQTTYEAEPNAARTAAGMEVLRQSHQFVVKERGLSPEFGAPIPPREQEQAADLPVITPDGTTVGAPGQGDTPLAAVKAHTVASKITR